MFTKMVGDIPAQSNSLVSSLKYIHSTSTGEKSNFPQLHMGENVSLSICLSIPTDKNPSKVIYIQLFIVEYTNEEGKMGI